ncbi:MAG: SPOR domain-containing protein [Acidobacteriota bacterium]
MNDTDQRFYEIQLNTHHLLFAFLGAVGVGVAIFYLGVVVGRGHGSDQLGEDFQAASVAEGAATASDREPLKFYESVQEPATQGGGASEPSQQQSAKPVEASQQAPLPGQPAATSPDAASAGETAPVPVTERAELPEADPTIAIGWVVQVLSNTDRALAEAVQASLASDGYPAFVVTADINGVTFYRVRVGRYRDEAAARSVEGRLSRRQDVESTWVTEG